MQIKKYSSELFGTFALSFVVLISLNSHFTVATPVLAALVLGVFVYTIGHISGTHINPAVTIGLWSIKKIETKEAVFYIIAQFLGGILALILGHILLGNISTVANAQSIYIGIAEALGTMLFTFGIASVVYKKTPNDVSGVAIGTSLLIGIVISASLGANGILNPSVALAINSFNLSYLFGPIVGSVAGFNLYKYLEG